MSELELNKIHLMDCLKGIKQIPTPNLIITDPPYEFENKGGGLYSLERTQRVMNKIKEIGTNSFDFNKFIPKILDIQKDKVNAYFFCNKKLLPNYLSLAVKKQLSFDVLVFRKLNPIPAFNNSYMNELEYIVFLRSKGAYFSSKEGYQNYKKVYEENIGHHGLSHPNQKPTNLIRQFVRVSSKEKDLICDPFMGVGTTAVACKSLNRNFIGFEIVENYIKIAAKRLAQSTLTWGLQ